MTKGSEFRSLFLFVRKAQIWVQKIELEMMQKCNSA
jgi:hypothetical protein